MALFVLRKFILQTRMCSHPVGLDVWFYVDHFSSSILHVCEQRRLWRDCADTQAIRAVSPEPSLVAYVISTLISWAGSFRDHLTFVPSTCKSSSCQNLLSTPEPFYRSPCVFLRPRAKRERFSFNLLHVYVGTHFFHRHIVQMSCELHGIHLKSRIP